MADIQELDPADIQFIQNKAEEFLKLIEESMEMRLTYDSESVEKLSALIEEIRAQAPVAEIEHLVDPCGYLLGEAILRLTGGRWVLCDQVLAIQLKNGGVAFPPSRVAKQFKNGLEDSVFALYRYCQHASAQTE